MEVLEFMRLEFNRVHEKLDAQADEQSNIKTDIAIIRKNCEMHDARACKIENDIKPLKERVYFNRGLKERMKTVSVYVALISAPVSIALGIIMLKK